MNPILRSIIAVAAWQVLVFTIILIIDNFVFGKGGGGDAMYSLVAMIETPASVAALWFIADLIISKKWTIANKHNIYIYIYIAILIFLVVITTPGNIKSFKWLFEYIFY